MKEYRTLPIWHSWQDYRDCLVAPMIRLTRLNNQPLAVNADLIKFVEQAPDTVLTLINGEKLVVRESAAEVLARILEFRRSILANSSAPATCAVQPTENAESSS